MRACCNKDRLGGTFRLCQICEEKSRKFVGLTRADSYPASAKLLRTEGSPRVSRPGTPNSADCVNWPCAHLTRIVVLVADPRNYLSMVWRAIQAHDMIYIVVYLHVCVYLYIYIYIINIYMYRHVVHDMICIHVRMPVRMPPAYM